MARADELLERSTVTPPLGAFVFKVTVATGKGWLPPTVTEGLTVNELKATFTGATGCAPTAEEKMLSLPLLSTALTLNQ